MGTKYVLCYEIMLDAQAEATCAFGKTYTCIDRYIQSRGRISYRVAQYQFFFINSISIILFPFLSIPISMSINIKRAYQYQCVINYWKVPLSISISMSINWLPYQYQYQYFNSYQNLLKSVHVWNLCIIKRGSTAKIVRQR